MIRIHEHTFDHVNDEVKTEQTIFDNIKSNEKQFAHLNYVALPVCHLINTRGLPYTQQVLNIIQNKTSGRKTYVCQHIHVKHLNFFDNVVYTPHTLSNDHLRVIPHYNPCIRKQDYIEPEDREFRFSFVGSYRTNSMRSKFASLGLQDSIIEDTGEWHFYKNNKQAQTEKYRNILHNTKYALCPPGTGCSTIRLYESMAAGCIPVLFNNVKVPKVMEKLVIRITDLNQLHDLDSEINHHDIYKTYWDNISNKYMHQLLLS